MAIFISDDGEHLILRETNSRIQVISLRVFLNRLEAQPDNSDITVGVREGQKLWRERLSYDSFRTVEFSCAHNRLAIISAGQIDIRSTSDGTPLALFHTETGAMTSAAFSPDGRHLACYFAGEIQLWNIEKSACITRIVLLRDTDNETIAGAVALAGPRFQCILREGASAPPSLEGFYARAGVHLHPLESLAHLESKNLIDDLHLQVAPDTSSS